MPINMLASKLIVIGASFFAMISSGHYDLTDFEVEVPSKTMSTTEIPWNIDKKFERIDLHEEDF